LARDLEIARSQAVDRLLPDLDLHELGLVREIYIEGDVWDRWSSTMEFKVACRREGKDYLLTVVFRSIRKAVLPNLDPTFMFEELEIEDVSKDSLEGIRFRAEDLGKTGFEVFCESIEFTDCVLLADGSESGSVGCR